MKRRHTLLLAAAALGLASPAGAAPITFAFEASVVLVHPVLSDRFDDGDPVTGEPSAIECRPEARR
jgi:hypothetical protein